MHDYKFGITMSLAALQVFYNAIEEKEQEALDEGREKDAHEYYQARKELETQLERHNVRFVE